MSKIADRVVLMHGLGGNRLEMNALAEQGKEMLESAEQVTQFYNRDAGDAQQGAADTALTQFIADPTAVDRILAEWQAAAEKVRAGQ